MTQPGKIPTLIQTAHGPIRLPAYLPVTTFGEKYPLDDLVRPYLPRIAQAVMVSFHYAKQMKERPNLPLFIDSGGFASLFENATVQKVGELGILQTDNEGVQETLHPRDVLEFQERHADVAFTLDFPVPPSMAVREAQRRLKLTIANARWALENGRRKDMLIFACVQGWDVASYRRCAEAYDDLPADGIAIGGPAPAFLTSPRCCKIVVRGPRDSAGQAPPRVRPRQTRNCRCTLPSRCAVRGFELLRQDGGRRYRRARPKSAPRRCLSP